MLILDKSNSRFHLCLLDKGRCDPPDVNVLRQIAREFGVVLQTPLVSPTAW